MNFYIIELEDRIKIGIATCTEKRFTNLLSAGGHGAKDVLNLFEFTDTGIIEQPLIRLFRPFLIEQSKYNKGREWFYKKGLVKIFLDEIKNGTKPCKELIQQIQYKNIDSKIDYNNNAIKIFEKIKAERKNIGFPNSVTFEKFLKKNEMRYRNMIYLVEIDFKAFTRHPNFEFEEISNSQMVECLRIIKNNTKGQVKKVGIQSLIDNVFNQNYENERQILSLIKNYFFNNKTKKVLLSIKDIAGGNISGKFEIENKKINSDEIEKIPSPNVRIFYDKELNSYYLLNKYENLTDEEYVLIKKSRNIELHNNFIAFYYKERICYCDFDIKSLLRIKNLLKNSDYTSKLIIAVDKVLLERDELLPQKRSMKRLSK